MNESGIQPSHFNVLVKPRPVEGKTSGGLLLPDSAKDKDAFGRTEGQLVATSPVAFSYAKWPEGARIPTIGDWVIFSKYQATEIKGDDGADYWLMSDTAIAGVKA